MTVSDGVRNGRAGDDAMGGVTMAWQAGARRQETDVVVDNVANVKLMSVVVDLLSKGTTVLMTR